MPTKAARKFVSEFIIEVPPVTITGSLTTVAAPALTKSTALKSICPVHGHDDPKTIKQNLVCSEDDTHGPFTSQEVLKARETDKGTLVPVDKDEAKAAAKSELTENVLTLAVYNATDVDAYTYPDGKAYVFYPKVASGSYGVIADLVAEPDLAFIGVCNIKGQEKLLRLKRWDDILVVQQLLYPEELNVRERTAIDYKGEFLEMMLQFVEPQAFVPDEYQNQRRARMAALTAGVQGVPVAPAGKQSPKSEDDAAMDALREILAKKTA